MYKDISDFGFTRIAAVTPEMKVADIEFNTGKIIEAIDIAAENHCSIAVFPELSITGYTCGDLFFQPILLDKAKEAIDIIARHTADKMITAIVGAPVVSNGKLFDCAVFISNGEIGGIVPKTYICNYNEFYEERWFSSEYDRTADEIEWNGEEVPFGADLLFRDSNNPSCLIGIEICEDLWATVPPSMSQAQAGATVLVNLSASNEILGKFKYRTELVTTQSARCLAAYIYSGAGPGESTTDLVYSGHSLIAEYGKILAQTKRFEFGTQVAFADIDISRLTSERTRNASFGYGMPDTDYRIIDFVNEGSRTPSLSRKYDKMPFVPAKEAGRAETCREIFSIQTTGLAKRLKHLGMEKVFAGISGGLDSTLALLVAVRTFKKLGLEPAGINAITMPGFGTTTRTKSNAAKLAQKLGVTLRTIPIQKTVGEHFKAIGQNGDDYDVTYENAQARQRTNILMDLANKNNGIMIGTGDLSELALGWCTFGGDHMSMYSVNSGIPKTLVRYIVEWCADEEFGGEISKVLRDICSTPISPELLPAGPDGQIAQLTEEAVGPYILHDFFLYYTLRWQFPPQKTLLIATETFRDEYEETEILRWLRNFYSRFFASQFKRSCIPDGIKVGTVALSPRGDWRMPSDASAAIWLKELENL